MPRFAPWHFGHMVPPHGAAPHHPGFGPPQPPPPSNGNMHQPYVNGYVYPHHTASPGPHPPHANGHPGAPPPPGHPGAPPPARYLEPNYMNGSYGAYHHHQPHHQQ